MSMTGLIHLLALIYKKYEFILTNLTVIIRVFISSVFFALYTSNNLGIESLFVLLFDFIFATIYLILQKEKLCKE